MMSTTFVTLERLWAGVVLTGTRQNRAAMLNLAISGAMAKATLNNIKYILPREIHLTYEVSCLEMDASFMLILNFNLEWCRYSYGSSVTRQSWLSTKKPFFLVDYHWSSFLKHSQPNSLNLAFWACRSVARCDSGVPKLGFVIPVSEITDK